MQVKWVERGKSKWNEDNVQKTHVNAQMEEDVVVQDEDEYWDDEMAEEIAIVEVLSIWYRMCDENVLVSDLPKNPRAQL